VEQVAVDRTRPNGRVIGIDIIPAQPPNGASTIQGNFLSPKVQAEVKEYLREPNRGRLRGQSIFTVNDEDSPITEEELEHRERSLVELERHVDVESTTSEADGPEHKSRQLSRKEREQAEGKMVDVVLSDMSEPWDQTSGFWKRSLSNPHSRMMNVSGMSFRDHAGSMVRLLDQY
jgi:21S rRNA (uridine2791-2'-O)-methyltransferase